MPTPLPPLPPFPRDAKGHFLPRKHLTSVSPGADATPAPMPLYTHVAHPHTPRNVNEQHTAERTGLNDRIATLLTMATGNMWCAYLFGGIGVGSLVGVITNNLTLALLFGAVSSYFLQLIFLPIIQTGTNILSRHAEIQSTEEFHNVERLLHEQEQQRRHLDAQDAELLKQTTLLISLLQATHPKE